jgi:hypothetical protein
MKRLKQYIYEAKTVKAADDKPEPRTPGETGFDSAKAEKDALKWLAAKYGEKVFVFKRIEGLDMNGDPEDVKSYSISVDGNAYTLNLRRFEDMPDGSSKQGEKGKVVDILAFDVLPPQTPEEDDESEKQEL